MPSGPEVYAASSPRVRANRRRRRDEILRAALQAFREKGYHSTTLEDIAEHVGVRKTALYHYFRDKEALLYECHRVSLATLTRLADQARARHASAADQLAFVIKEHVRVMTGTLQGSPLALEVTALSPDLAQHVIAARDAYERDLRNIIETGIQRGELRPVDPKIAVFAILGAINWIARWYRPEGRMRTRELGEQFAAYLVRGLTCREPR